MPTISSTHFNTVLGFTLFPLGFWSSQLFSCYNQAALLFFWFVFIWVSCKIFFFFLTFGYSYFVLAGVLWNCAFCNISVCIIFWVIPRIGLVEFYSFCFFFFILDFFLNCRGNKVLSWYVCCARGRNFFPSKVWGRTLRLIAASASFFLSFNIGSYLEGAVVVFWFGLVGLVGECWKHRLAWENMRGGHRHQVGYCQMACCPMKLPLWYRCLTRSDGWKLSKGLQSWLPAFSLILPLRSAAMRLPTMSNGWSWNASLARLVFVWVSPPRKSLFID